MQWLVIPNREQCSIPTAGRALQSQALCAILAFNLHSVLYKEHHDRAPWNTLYRHIALKDTRVDKCGRSSAHHYRKTPFIIISTYVFSGLATVQACLFSDLHLLTILEGYSKAEWKLQQGQRSLFNLVLSLDNTLLCMFQWLCTCRILYRGTYIWGVCKAIVQSPILRPWLDQFWGNKKRKGSKTK